MRRALGSALAIALAGALALVPGAPGAAAATTPALGPAVVGWWNATNRDMPAAQVPPPDVVPPDVGPEDLYVAGTQDAALPADPPVALGPVGPAALAGLVFQLPEGASARTLTLTLTGVQPPAVSLQACRALEEFLPAYDGRWEDAPAYDCTDAGTSRLTSDGHLVVDGIDRLRRGRTLAVVLVPGPLDRVVVAPPRAGVLTYQAGAEAQPVLAPPAPQGAVLQPAPVAGPPDATFAPESALGQVPAQTGSELGGDVTPPTVAVVPPLRAARAVVPARSRGLLLVVLLASAVAFGVMLRPRRALPGGVHGVGRLRAERSGTAPELI